MVSLVNGDLTTPARAKVWIPELSASSDPILAQLISSMSGLIYSKLNRPRTFSQTFTRIIDGTGNYQILLPDYPVTGITSIQMGAIALQPYPLPNPTTAVVPDNTVGYGYRFSSWGGDLPGEPAMVEFVNGFFSRGNQNIKVVYTAGYLIANEAATIPASGTFAITVAQPQGIWCKDGGVVYASDGVALTPVSALTGAGQYIPPTDSTLGTYTFDPADADAAVLISYSFIPTALEEACIQMVAERNSYRSRIGQIDRSLAGQETIRFFRGGGRNQAFVGMPPEVEDLIWPFVNVAPPVIGAPV